MNKNKCVSINDLLWFDHSKNELARLFTNCINNSCSEQACLFNNGNLIVFHEETPKNTKSTIG
jgi:hypothetical protein